MTLHVLYVDADLDTAAIVAFAMEAVPDCRLTVCVTGQAALVEMAARPPQLVLLECRLPDMSGQEALNQLRQLPGCAYVPVVFVTDCPETRQSTALRLLGAMDVIAKPFNPVILASQIQHAWRNDWPP